MCFCASVYVCHDRLCEKYRRQMVVSQQRTPAVGDDSARLKHAAVKIESCRINNEGLERRGHRYGMLK